MDGQVTPGSVIAPAGDGGVRARDPACVVRSLIEAAQLLGDHLAGAVRAERPVRVAGGRVGVLDERPQVAVERHPPLLGEHTGEILRERLAFSEAQIDDLRRDGAI